MNTTTLNMTTLDGGVIIKKGEGGGGATINNQDKVVDITENGTTEVVADGGFTGLGKVTINTEVSGGESGGSTLEYLDVSGQTNTFNNALAMYADIVKGEGVDAKVKFIGLNDEMIRIASGIRDGVIAYSAMAVDFSRTVKMINTEDSSQKIEMSMIEVLTRTGISRDVYDSLPRITKEQFYTLD